MSRRSPRVRPDPRPSASPGAGGVTAEDEWAARAPSARRRRRQGHGRLSHREQGPEAASHPGRFRGARRVGRESLRPLPFKSPRGTDDCGDAGLVRPRPATPPSTLPAPPDLAETKFRACQGWRHLLLGPRDPGPSRYHPTRGCLWKCHTCAWERWRRQ